MTEGGAFGMIADLHLGGKRGAFLCSAEIAASRFALLAMTP
jgi:hypothetical protein